MWATPTYPSLYNVMSVTFAASTSVVPPSDRAYLLELTHVPDGISGADPIGTVWELPVRSGLTLDLPTYRTTDGLTGYRFKFTITEAEPGPGDLDNDGDVDRDDHAALTECITGPGGQPGIRCSPEALDRSDIDDDGSVGLADFSMFTRSFTGLLTSRPEYAGAASCIECHEEDHEDWSGTRHAGAFETLVIDGEADNPVKLPVSHSRIRSDRWVRGYEHDASTGKRPM